MTIHAAARVAELVADESAYARALALLPRERQVKAGSLRFAADRFRSVAVWLLLERLLAGAGIDASGRELSKNAFGKPSFADGRGPQFNLSHGGDWVLAAVGEGLVGCDVERVTRVREDVVAACFAPAERDYVASFRGETARARAFCRVWVRKEAYVKADGRGLSLDFPSFSVAPGEFPQGWNCLDLDLGDGHLGAVVAPEIPNP